MKNRLTYIYPVIGFAIANLVAITFFDNPLVRDVKIGIAGIVCFTAFLALTLLALPFYIWYLYVKRMRDAKQKLQEVQWSGSNLFPLVKTPSCTIKNTDIRALSTNPFLASTSGPAFYRSMELAAQASVEHGRTLGVIYFKLDVVSRQQKNLLIEEVEMIAGDLRRLLRSSDYVTVVKNAGIVVCISLLKSNTDLNAIAERMRKAGFATGLLGSTFARCPGLAMYPIDGYSGEALVDRARRDQIRSTRKFNLPRAKTRVLLHNAPVLSV